MKTFNDLIFKNKFSIRELEFFPKGKDAKQAKMSFDNDFGVSVVTGHGSYTNKENPYEIAVLFDGDLCYSTYITENVIGCCDENKVTEIMKQIQEL